MKLETAIIHKTEKTVSLVPHLTFDDKTGRKNVAFYIRGEYFAAQTADNLYNRVNPLLPPALPKAPKDRISQTDFPEGDITCYILDRGVDIEIIVE